MAVAGLRGSNGGFSAGGVTSACCRENVTNRKEETCDPQSKEIVMI